MAIILGENVPRVRALFAADDGDANEAEAEDALAAAAASAREAGAGERATRAVGRAATTGRETATGRGHMAGAGEEAALSAVRRREAGAGAAGARRAQVAGAGTPTPGRAASGASTRAVGRPAPAATPQAAAAEGTPVELDGAESIALSPAEVRWLQTLRADYALSDREAQVAVLIAQGRSKAAIARHLYVSENTVRTHAKNAYAKLGVRSKAELAELLEDLGE